MNEDENLLNDGQCDGQRNERSEIRGRVHHNRHDDEYWLDAVTDNQPHEES